jgi:hypothetical protein
MVAKALFAISVLLLGACGTGSQFNWEESEASQSIRRPLEANIELFKMCLDHERKLNPDVEGDLTMDWVLDDMGNASKASRRHGKILQGDFVFCIDEKLESIKFFPAEPGKSLPVTYTSQFQRKSK